MLVSLCSDGETYVWGIESQNLPSFPNRPFHVDTAAVRRLYYAVDPTWISYTFAVTFLALCYIRGVIDGKSEKPNYKYSLFQPADQVSSIFPRGLTNTPRQHRLPGKCTSFSCRLGIYHFLSSKTCYRCIR